MASKQRRNFDEAGHISTELRTGKDRTDAYRFRSKRLVNAAEDLESITGAMVRVDVIPTWKGIVNHMHFWFILKL